jgi:small nuclear ribonucleoprotein (snRNP)-like protein
MTDSEVRPWVGKSVRATLADGRVIAGTLRAEDAHGHGHAHYVIESAPVRPGEGEVREMIHGAESFVQIEDASKDPAAR